MSKQIHVGAVAVGGGAPVSIQSMCNTPTQDVERTVSQILRLEQAGCQIIRVAVPDMDAARAIGPIRRRIHIPLVADIHFDYRLALECVRQGVDKIRINPGNIGSAEKVRAVADACRDRGIPIRIGVNGGSLERELLQKYGGVTAQALVDSALGHVRLLNDCNFDDICISVKCSHVPVNMAAYRMLHEQTHYPLHLGVTEAGTPRLGVLKSAVGIGGLLCQGIGDTLRVRRRSAENRARPDLLPHLRPHPVRHDPHRPGGGAPPSGLHQAHHRGGHGLRGQRPRRGPGRRCGHCRRRRRGPAVPPWRNSAQGPPGQAGGRPDG